MTEKRATIWVCTACGKRSRDRYGNKRISHGWDESCMLHAVECYEDSITLTDGRVTGGTAVEKSPATDAVG